MLLCFYLWKTWWKLSRNTVCVGKVCRKVSSKLGCWSNETLGTDVTETERRVSRRNRPAGPTQEWCPFVSSGGSGPGYQTAWCCEMCGSRALLSLPDCETEASPDQMVSYSKLCTAFCHRVTSHQLQSRFVFHSLKLPPDRLRSHALWRGDKIHEGFNLLLWTFVSAVWQRSGAGKPVVTSPVKVLLYELLTALTSLLTLKVFF